MKNFQNQICESQFQVSLNENLNLYSILIKLIDILYLEHNKIPISVCMY